MRNLREHAAAVAELHIRARRPAMVEVDEAGNAADWGTQVSDEEYSAPAGE